MKTENASKQAGCSEQELNAVAGGGLNPSLSCKYCGAVHGSFHVETKSEKLGCSYIDRWKCPDCGKWQ